MSQKTKRKDMNYTKQCLIIINMYQNIQFIRSCGINDDSSAVLSLHFISLTNFIFNHLLWTT